MCWPVCVVGLAVGAGAGAGAGAMEAGLGLMVESVLAEAASCSSSSSSSSSKTEIVAASGSAADIRPFENTELVFAAGTLVAAEEERRKEEEEGVGCRCLLRAACCRFKPFESFPFAAVLLLLLLAWLVLSPNARRRCPEA